MKNKKMLGLLAVICAIFIIFCYIIEKEYIIKPKVGDNPYDAFYCAVYDISPKNGEGILDPPPKYLSVKIDTDAPPKNVFVKFEWEDDWGIHRSGRIFLNNISTGDGFVYKIDQDTYEVFYKLYQYTSPSRFKNFDHYEWWVEVYYCKNPTGGTGEGMWYVCDYWTFYTYEHPPENRCPIADAGGPYYANVGEVIVLDGSNSHAYLDDWFLTGYLWDINNDGTWDLSGKKPKISFNAEKTYTVRLRVFDENALYNDDITTITVSNVNNPPIADADGPYYGKIGEIITLDGSGSYDPDGNTLSYEWDTDGDGKYDASGEKVNIKYFAVGNYTVTLKVSDGQYSDTDTTYVVISSSEPENQLPVADANGPYYGNVSEPITLDGSGSYDPDGYITTWRWDINNDGIYDADGEYATVSFKVSGEYTVKLMVIDNDGGVSYDTTTITIHQPQIGGEEEFTWNKQVIFGLLLIIIAIIILVYIFRKKV